ncbi:MAG: 2-deoxyribose-5-phosphate aldolase, partial [Clostridiales bacterium]
RKATELVLGSGADFVKTSTGFGTDGAKISDIRLIKEIVGNRVGIKASGGIRDREKALKMVEAGATRIGASASVKIVESGGKNER